MQAQIVQSSVRRVGITDAIRRVMEQGPRTPRSVVDIVSGRLNVDRKTITTIIGQRISAGEFVRDGRKVRLRG